MSNRHTDNGYRHKAIMVSCMISNSYIHMLQFIHYQKRIVLTHVPNRQDRKAVAL